MEIFDRKECYVKFSDNVGKLLLKNGALVYYPLGDIFINESGGYIGCDLTEEAFFMSTGRSSNNLNLYWPTQYKPYYNKMYANRYTNSFCRIPISHYSKTACSSDSLNALQNAFQALQLFNDTSLILKNPIGQYGFVFPSSFKLEDVFVCTFSEVKEREITEYLYQDPISLDFKYIRDGKELFTVEQNEKDEMNTHLTRALIRKYLFSIYEQLQPNEVLGTIRKNLIDKSIFVAASVDKGITMREISVPGVQVAAFAEIKNVPFFSIDNRLFSGSSDKGSFVTAIKGGDEYLSEFIDWANSGVELFTPNAYIKNRGDEDAAIQQK